MRPLVEYTRIQVTRLRARTITDNNSEVLDWTDPEQLTIEDVKLDPAGTDEDTRRGESRLFRYALQVPDLSADIEGTDRIQLPGDPGQWSIVGQPLVQPSMMGIGYIGFQIERWEG